MEVLVIGGSGRIGTPTCQKLKEDGFNVRILTRNEEKARKKFQNPSNFTFIVGDVKNNIDKALKGVKFLVLSFFGADEVSMLKSVLKAAAKVEELERIALIGGASTCEESAKCCESVKEKYLCEMELVKFCEDKKYLSYHIFRSFMVMETLEMSVRDGKGNILGNKKKQQLFYYVAAIDIGRMISIAFQIDDSKNKTFYCYGPNKRMTQKEALQIYMEECYPACKDKIGFFPIWILKALGFLTRNKELKKLAGLFEFFESTDVMNFVDMTKFIETKEILGENETTLEEWSKERKKHVPKVVEKPKKKSYWIPVMGLTVVLSGATYIIYKKFF